MRSFLRKLYVYQKEGVKGMKRLCSVCMCLTLLMTGTIGIQEAKAEETYTYTGDPIEDGDQSGNWSEPQKPSAEEVLSKITMDDLTIFDAYSHAMRWRIGGFGEDEVIPGYETPRVYYQQGTGHNSFSAIRFDLNEIDGHSYSIGTSGEDHEGNCYHDFHLSLMNINNPAHDVKGFIDTPQDFEISFTITLSDVKSGKSRNIGKMSLPARVVKVEGTIIKNKLHNLKHGWMFSYEDSLELLKEWNNQINFDTVVVELLDGTISEVRLPSYPALIAYGVAGGWPDPALPVGFLSANDFRYINNVDTSDVELDPYYPGELGYYNRGEHGLAYLIDKNGNLVDYDGKIVMPYSKRPNKQYKTTKDKVSMSAKEGTMPDNSLLDIKELILDLNRPYLAYDMTLMANGEKIQPVGKVEIASVIPAKLKNKKNLSVYYLNDKGKLTEVSGKVVNDKITFETDHFSTYVITEKLSDEELKNIVVKKIGVVSDGDDLNKINDKDVIKDTGLTGGNVNTGINQYTAIFTLISMFSLFALYFMITKKKKQNRQ